MVSSITDTHCQFPSDNLLKPLIDQVNHKFPSLLKLLTAFLQSEVSRVHSLVWKFVGNHSLGGGGGGGGGGWNASFDTEARGRTWPRPSFFAVRARARESWARSTGAGRSREIWAGRRQKVQKARIRRESLVWSINRCESLSSQNHIAKLLE